ncbi:MAG: hypothetical protein GX345_09155 [Clostridiales bacterium]|nr:hypothetical protein [Clostridiales bacterium]
MKNFKRFLGIFLTLALIYSSVSFGATAADVSGGAQANALQTFSTSDFRRPSPVIGLEATDVIRVGDESDSSMSAGNTIKRATPSGVPFVTGDFTSQAYAGEEPVWPSVTFTSSEAVNITSVSASGSGVNVNFTLEDGSIQNTNYARWEIQGGTANADSHVKYTIEYTYRWLNPYTGVYVTDTYKTTTQSYVENVIFPAGAWVFAAAYTNVNNTADVRYVSRILGKGVYGAPIQLKSASGDYQSGHNNFANNAFVPTADDIPERTMIKVDPPHSAWGDQYLANGVSPYSTPDLHRAKAMVYLDTSVHTMESNNVRMHFFINGDHRSTHKARDLTYETIHVRDGDVAYEGSTGNVLGESHAGALAALNPTGPLDGTISTGGLFLHLGMEETSTLYGNGAAGQYTLVTQWTGKGDEGDGTGISANWMQYYHAVVIEIVNISKAQLRNALNKSVGVEVKTVDGSEKVTTILTSSGTDPNTGLTSASDGKGSNPQEWYYSGGWSAYDSAYDNAWKYMTKPDVAQAASNSTATSLNNSYNGLTLRKANYNNSTSQYLVSGLGNSYFGSNIQPLDNLVDIVDNKDIGFQENLKDWQEGTYHYFTEQSRAALEEAYAAAVQAQADEYSVIYQPYLDYLASELQDAIENLDYNEFAVSFDGNGNTSGSMAELYAKPGMSFNLPAISFEKEGHSFLGWTLVKDGEVVYADGANFTVGTEDIVLYAKWDLNNYTITFDADGGEGGSSESLPYGSALEAPEVTKTGHQFIEWLPAPPSTVPAQDATYVAQWVKLSYTFTFDANGGVGGDEFTLTYGDPITPPEVERAGYIFAGWDPTVPDTAPAESMIFTAQWTPDLYTVTFDANGGEGGTSYQAAYGEQLIAPAVTRTGYDFVGWDPALPPTMPAEDVTYTAVWSARLYTIVFDANGGIFPELGGVNFHQTKQAFESPLEAPLATRSGYEFDGWDPELPETVPGRTTFFSAKWKLAAVTETTVTFNLNGGSGTTPAAQTGDIGSPVVLPPQGNISRTGYSFLGWAASSVATSPLTSYQFQSTDTTLYAVWQLNVYDITFVLDNGAANIVVPTDHGAMPQAPEGFEKEGYSFLGWDPAIGVATEDTTYTALWEEDIVEPTVFTITFVLANGEDDIELQVEEGEMPKIDDPVREGYTFGGWSPELTEATEDTTYTAQWNIKVYDITFVLDNGEDDVVVATDHGAMPEAPEGFEKEGYTFKEWTPGLTEATEATTYTAVWDKVLVTLFPQPGSGTVLDHSDGDRILGILPGTSEEEFLSDYVGVTGYGELRFSENDGRFGTGRKVELIDLETEEVLESYYIIIFGDVNGDGLVDQDDLDLIKEAALFVSDFDVSYPYKVAADLNGDGIIDAFDLNLFKAAIKGVFQIDPVDPLKNI